MRDDTCQSMNPVKGAAMTSDYKILRHSFRGPKSEPAGPRKEFNPLIPHKTSERTFVSSQGMHRSTWDGKLHSSVRELAVDPDLEELRKALRKHSSSRDILYGRRLEMREKRNELRQERVLLVNADDSFMKFARRFPERDHFDFEDGPYFKLEQQRDLVGSLQYEYDQAEDEYDIAENELVNEEGKLNDLLSKYLNEPSDTSDEHTSEPTLDSHLQLEEPQYCNEEDEARVRLAEYQSRVGDARIMEERLQDLLSDREERNSFAMKRETLGVDRGGSDEDFTENFEYRYTEIVDELVIIHADIERLKDGLIQAGHVFPKANSTDRPPEVLAYQAHPQPRPACSPLPRQRPLSGSILHSLQKNFATTRANISRWILNTFGSSPVECARHKEILRELRDESLDDEEWACLVFEHWKQAARSGDDDISTGSWDEILPGDLQENTSQNRPIPIRTPFPLSGRSEATHAMNGFLQQFPRSAPGDHAKPYETEVELDEYESRSV